MRKGVREGWEGGREREEGREGGRGDRAGRKLEWEGGG